MLARDTLKSLINLGNHAPSGDNSQPWRFGLIEDGIKIYITPEHDNPIYNVNLVGSLIAVGAVVQNILMAARAIGLDGSFKIDGENESLSVSINFVKGPSSGEAIEETIIARSTNRKPYKERLLTGPEKKSLLEIDADIKTKIILIEDSTEKKILADELSNNERILLENNDFRKAFFGHVVWPGASPDQKKRGLLVSTLELNPIQKFFFKLYSTNFARILNFMKIGNRVAKDNAKVYSRSSAFAVFSTENSNPADLIDVGRAFEQFWLSATKNHLSCQPVTGLLLLHNRLRADSPGSLNQAQQNVIEKAYVKVAEIAGIKEPMQAIAILRIGESDPPSERSPRVNPDILE